MKKILLSTTYFLAGIFSVHAQILYGTTFNGGENSGGTINKFTPATNTLTLLKSFGVSAANPLYTNLTQANDGKLYGMTSAGGSYTAGTIFSFDPSTSHFTILQHFDYAKGTNPEGSLIQLSDGKLYGMTAFGGDLNFGVIFSFDPATNIYNKLKSFDNTNGARPGGSLILAGDGKLYGMTSKGGAMDNGVIFSFDVSTATYTKLEDFDYTNGANPNGSLLEATGGKFYGMTVNGGVNSDGVIFSFDPSTSAFTKLVDFDGSNGAGAYGSLIQAGDGKLYGVTHSGGIGFGTIFSFDPSDSVCTTLKSFDNSEGGADEGSFPNGSLIKASDGKLYGLTSDGGTTRGGVIFSFDPVNAAFTKLKELDASIGTHPNGSLIQTPDGKLYGMTYDGAGSDMGDIFSFDPSASIYTKLKDFKADGPSNVAANLMQAGNGKLYGVTLHNNSNLFSLDPSSSSYTSLMSFGNDNPTGAPVQAVNGKLYGMVSGGDRFLYGYIYSFDPSSSTYTELRRFGNQDDEPNDGAVPTGSFIKAGDGKLYGMTTAGGSHAEGVIFSFDPTSATYTSVYDFDYFTNGGRPNGSSLVQAGNGKLYGMAAGGINDAGVIFSFDPASSTYEKLKDFDSTDGAYSTGSLIQANDGKLYGMTTEGGSNLAGVIFSYDPATATFTSLKDFDYTNGAHPYGSLLQASDGKLYGTTTAGGTGGNGVIFSYDLSSSTYTKLIDYNFSNGANPGSAFIEVPEEGPLPVTLISFTGKNNGNYNLLSWKVGNEQNLNYYELQRSIDGQNFKAISQIKATGNNTYTFNDLITASAFPLYYYRLKSTDKDDKSTYSTVIKIRTGHNGFITVNPNPFKDKLVVNIESLTRDKATFTIADAGGRKLYKEDRILYPGTNVVEINDTRRLSKGTYLLTVISSQQTQSIKVVKGN